MAHGPPAAAMTLHPSQDIPHHPAYPAPAPNSNWGGNGATMPRLPTLPPPPQDPMAALGLLIQAQQNAALELQALFELCVAHGLIERREYLERLAKINDS
jgi:hypothetical protein